MTITRSASEYNPTEQIELLNQVKIVAIDTETSGLSIKTGRDYLQGISLAADINNTIHSWYLPIRHPEGNINQHWLNEWVNALKGKTLIFHNRKFDLHSLNTAGIDLSGNYAYDVLLLAQLINEEYPHDKSLDTLASHYLHRKKRFREQIHAWGSVFGWDSIPVKFMEPYAREDAELTLAVYNVLFSRYLEQYKDDSASIWQWELDFNTALYNMERRGVGVDIDFCRQYTAIADLEMLEVENQLGFQPSKTTDLSKFLFDDLGLPVLERTPTGKPKMDKNIMLEYEKILSQVDDDRAALVLQYRGWQKAKGTFYEPFQRLLAPDGKIHCNYKQHGTVTGRLSCEEPNLQQIPRNSDKEWNGRIRSAFKPQEGYRLLGFDYSQLELRLAAAYGRERWLIAEFSKPDSDVFTALSERIGTDRYTAKTFTYALLYGAGKEKVAATLNRTVAEIEKPYTEFLESIPGILKVKTLSTETARRRHNIRYWTGRRRHFRDPNTSYKAFNSLLQGGAAEVVKRVLVEVNKNICDDDCRLLLQVHDELVFEIKEELVDYYSPFIELAMSDLPTKQFGVQFQVSSKEWG